ncbi:MAG: phosphoserine/homoserine phosphotransferase, partial [Ilumatobacter sp.]
EVIGTLAPMPGARKFLDALRERTQVIILSDTFEQFATPFMAQLGWPTIMCHRLIVDGDTITNYELRQQDQKRKAVEAFQSLNFQVIASGDSYNDTSMLGAAEVGFLFRSPDNVIAQFPQFTAFTEFDELLGAITNEL